MKDECLKGIMRDHPELHEQVEQLRDAVGDVPDPEDAQDYDGLQASMLEVYREAVDIYKAALAIGLRGGPFVEMIRTHVGHCKDACEYHEIEIPEDGE